MSQEGGLTVNISNEGECLFVHLNGRVSYAESVDFQSQLEDLLPREEKSVLFDCSGLDFISSAGLRAVLQFAKQAPAQGKKLGFFALQSNVSHVFEISGFTRILKIYPNKVQAVAGVTAG